MLVSVGPNTDTFGLSGSGTSEASTVLSVSLDAMASTCSLSSIMVVCDVMMVKAVKRWSQDES